MAQSTSHRESEAFTALEILREGGVPIRSIIDIGCADGTFSLEYLARFAEGREVSILNIDAQDTYESSLQEIRDTIGGHYKICAVSARDCLLRLARGSHPYWTTTKSKSGSDEYIECRSLDSILAEIGDLPAPYAIKMDIEGDEFRVLQGGVKALKNTACLILETEIYYAPDSSGNFLDIYNFLAARNFSLFDVTHLAYRSSDRALSQLYAIFLNQAYEFRHKTKANNSDARASLHDALVQRRQQALEYNQELLGEILASRLLSSPQIGEQ